MENHIEGFYGDNESAVLVDGIRLDPSESIKVRNHSPTGFSWGYGGSGPSQTALAILMHVLDERQALSLYQDFKWEHVARWPQGEDVDVLIDIPAWAARKRREFEVSTDDGA